MAARIHSFFFVTQYILEWGIFVNLYLNRLLDILLVSNIHALAQWLIISMVNSHIKCIRLVSHSCHLKNVCEFHLKYIVPWTALSACHVDLSELKTTQQTNSLLCTFNFYTSFPQKKNSRHKKYTGATLIQVHWVTPGWTIIFFHFEQRYSSTL